MTKTKEITSATTGFIVMASFVALAVLALSIPAFASAATYAYVDATGEVKSVTADTWMAAIDVAPNRHLHSGVLLLKSAGDFTIVGDDVKSI